MQQWIPKGHTLELKLWGEMGLRQGLYLGLGLLIGVMLFLLFSRFGLWVRIGAVALPPCVGLVVGFLKIKGLTPEVYLLHRLRFRINRANTLGVWDTGKPVRSPGGIRLGSISSPEGSTAMAPPVEPTPKRAKPVGKPSPPVVYLTDSGPFGPLFTLAAIALASAVLAYFARGVLH